MADNRRENTMKTKDELVKSFSEKMDQKVDREESGGKGLKATLFGDSASEYAQPQTSLPQSVSGRQILAESQQRADGCTQPGLRTTKENE
jgi:hypothetical protein